MNCGGDHYQDLLHFLEETENEINKAFEPIQNDTTSTDNNNTPEPVPVPNSEQADGELNLLIEINKSIQSDISELLAKNNIDEKSLESYKFYCNINGDLVVSSHGKKNAKPSPTSDNRLFCDGDSSSSKSSINVATQTSLSLSPSCSTNLTWTSDCSSSASSLSTSDSELLDDDAQSSASVGARERRPAFWRKQKVLNSKSSSTPILQRIVRRVNKQCRSQSDRYLAEIEASEACKWLRATGFPQYAQLYEDHQYPIDIATVAQDHPLLEPDELISLFRRLQILNGCAHLHQQRGGNSSHTDDSEDESCALSNNWTYQSDVKRWSRNCNKVACSNTDESARRIEAVHKKDDDVFEICTGSPKDRLRRAGSSKFRRRRDGVLFSDKDNSLLDSLNQTLSDLKICEVNHVSDSEITPKHTKQSRTKSFEKPEVWTVSHSSTNNVIWKKLPEKKECLPGKDVILDDKGPLMSHLSCTQLQVLKKLALLKLTAHMEKYCPNHRTGWNWELPKFMRKMKQSPYRDKNVFGVPLSITLQRTGQLLPANIEEAMRWLEENAIDQVGVFRKPGVKSRITALRNIVETNCPINYSEFQWYDIADMVKQYFRELPESLLTSKHSETFVYIFQHIPLALRRESILCTLLLMPDEHLEVLQALLHFLLTFAKNSSINQMDEYNISMCFAPSLFHYTLPPTPPKQSSGAPQEKDLAENRAASECLLYFLNNFDNLFRIPQEFINQCNSSEIKETTAKFLSDLGKDLGGWQEYLKECQANLLKEAKEKGRGWLTVTSHNSKVDIFFKKVADGLPFRLWKISTEIEAPPSVVLHRVLRERHIWDSELQSAKIISILDNKSEVFLYSRKDIVPLPNHEFCVVRSWRTDLPKDACTIVETSVEHPDVIQVPNTIRGIVLASRYLIEPCGSGKSRLVHLSRVDEMGRAPEWYQKNYGHLCAILLGNLQNSFCQSAVGPESKV